MKKYGLCSATAQIWYTQTGKALESYGFCVKKIPGPGKSLVRSTADIAPLIFLDQPHSRRTGQRRRPTVVGLLGLEFGSLTLHIGGFT